MNGIKEKIYLVALILIAVWNLIAISLFQYLVRAMEINGDAEIEMRKLVFTLLTSITATSFLAKVIGIVLRFRGAKATKLYSVALNIMLLFELPFGLLLGIYGLVFVDKERKSTEPSSLPQDQPTKVLPTATSR